jgi:N-acetylglucosamine kinase-like BadF-type ATPase
MSGIQDPSALGLGLDAGGTGTRWALAGAGGSIVAEGEVAGLSALQIDTEAGRQSMLATFATLARAVLVHGQPQCVHAGLTGFGGDSAAHMPILEHALADALSLGVQAVTLCSDIEIAYLGHFEPGQGYLVYAGTGSIGAWIDGAGQLHRAGGRGVMLDDGGGGFWIARQALRHIWRDEDEQPGRWRDSPMARAVFAQLGGEDWAISRQFVHAQQRGEFGKLALAVAASADADPVAAAILCEAGRELARLAQALIARFGARPVVLAGRASQLHPLILNSMRCALPNTIGLTQAVVHAHHGAALSAYRALAARA